MLEWVAIFFSRRFSRSRDQTWVSCIAGGTLTAKPPGKPSYTILLVQKYQFDSLLPAILLEVFISSAIRSILFYACFNSFIIFILKFLMTNDVI